MKQMIVPKWPAPSNIHAYTTLRSGGISKAPYDTFNLAVHVGDEEKQVQLNRQLLKETLHLPSEPFWLEQTHSAIVSSPTLTTPNKKADASFTGKPNQVCVVMTADCLPILVCDRQGTHIAAIHAGWRGLLNGIIENALQAMNLPPTHILAWLGPAIGPLAYEVGEDVRSHFLKKDKDAKEAFIPSQNNRGHWLCDLYRLAQMRLHKQNIRAIYGGEYCTYSDNKQFFSYRRDGNQTGRMASLIWMTE